MAILEGDIKLLASQVMDDVDEGGGAVTSVVIADGASNGIFPDIAELDRAYGNVSLRKVFAAVRSDNTDTYYKSYIALGKAPVDPRVSCALFSTDDSYDVRSNAKNRVEAYLARGARWPGYLLENHIAGQRTVSMWQRIGSDVPVSGQTLSLIKSEGLAGEVEQYVRVTRITDTAVRNFTDDTGEYARQIVTVEISDPLRYDFAGYPVSRIDPVLLTVRTIVRETLVADAAQYFGAAALTSLASMGDITVSVPSLFTALVPAAQTEIPITDARPNGLAQVVSAAGAAVSLPLGGASFGPGSAVYAGGAIAPGSVSLAIGSSATLVDRGGVVFDGATAVGVIDYGNGVISMAATSPAYGSVSKTLSFIPAGISSVATESIAVPVTAESRSLAFTTIFDPVPAPGTLSISYMAGGKWYALSDDGSGSLRGSDAANGAGTLSQATGSLSVTLGALPDVGSSLIVLWGSASQFAAGSAKFVRAPSFDAEFAQPIAPATITITATGGFSATDDGAGNLTGSAVGTVDYRSGKITIAPLALPSPGTVFACAAKSAPVVVSAANQVLSDAGAVYTCTIPGAPIAHASVEAQIECSVAIPDGTHTETGIAGYTDTTIKIVDRGDGKLWWKTYNGSGAVLWLQVGTINYTTGAATIFKTIANTVFGALLKVTRPGLFGLAPREVNIYQDVSYSSVVEPSAGLTAIKFLPATGGITDLTSSVTPTAYSTAISVTGSRRLLSGSASFEWGGKRFISQVGGTISEVDPLTGLVTNGGTINYITGDISITATGNTGASNTLTAINATLSALAINGDVQVKTLAFRTPVAPIRSASLTVLARTPAGVTVSATAGAGGSFSSGVMTGTVDIETGIVSLSFTEDVLGDTIRFAAVAYSYLPLDAETLGLDPVRLPSDGRVPIYREGGVVLVHHTANTSPATVSNGQTINCARVRLARARVIGSDGATINTGYTTDLDAGTVTFTDVSGYAQPVHIAHTIQDLALVSDAQLSGRLALTRSLTHDYPVGALVSSVLIVGNLKARMSVHFDQSTWSGVFDDAVSGSAAAATYNFADYPPVLTNRGAITERWAIVFTGSTTYKVVGEHVGQITTGDITTACSPLNASSGVPYFTLPALGWGGGWSAGNALRINTVGALAPIWVARTVQQGPATAEDDGIEIWILGDVDRP